MLFHKLGNVIVIYFILYFLTILESYKTVHLSVLTYFFLKQTSEIIGRNMIDLMSIELFIDC